MGKKKKQDKLKKQKEKEEKLELRDRDVREKEKKKSEKKKSGKKKQTDAGQSRADENAGRRVGSLYSVGLFRPSSDKKSAKSSSGKKASGAESEKKAPAETKTFRAEPEKQVTAEKKVPGAEPEKKTPAETKTFRAEPEKQVTAEKKVPGAEPGKKAPADAGRGKTGADAPAENAEGKRPGNVSENAEERRNLAAERFRALGDENRLQILALLKDTQLCAGDLLKSLNIVQSTLSHHMKVLTETGIVTCRKQGKWSYYSINSDLIPDLDEMLDKWG